MKKIISALLTLAMLLSLMAVFTGCGDKETEKKDTKEPTSSSTPADDNTTDVTLPAAISGISKMDVPDISGTGWELVGGIVDGVEMEIEDVQTVLTNFGGRMDFIFGEGDKVSLTNGETALETTYRVTDGKVIYMDFNEYKYHAVFTDVNGSVVLIIANETEPNSALYFQQLIVE